MELEGQNETRTADGASGVFTLVPSSSSSAEELAPRKADFSSSDPPVSPPRLSRRPKELMSDKQLLQCSSEPLSRVLQEVCQIVKSRPCDVKPFVDSLRAKVGWAVLEQCAALPQNPVAEIPTAVKLALLCSQKTSGVVLIGSDLADAMHAVSTWLSLLYTKMVPNELQVGAQGVCVRRRVVDASVKEELLCRHRPGHISARNQKRRTCNHRPRSSGCRNPRLAMTAFMYPAAS